MPWARSLRVIAVACEAGLAGRVIVRPALVASSRQRCSSRNSSSSSGISFFSGCRSIPGTIAPTSQLFWLISITAINVLSCSRAASDLLKSFGCGVGYSVDWVLERRSCLRSPLAP